MRPRLRFRRARGVTLVELMMSLAIIVIGLLVIFRVLSSSVNGSNTSSRVAQAQARAAAIVEAIRLSPPNALICLRNTAVASWNTCETLCLSLQTSPSASASSCIFTTASFANVKGPPTLSSLTNTTIYSEASDRLGQSYVLNQGTVPTGTTAQMGSTYVRQVGEGLRTWETVVTVGWNDNNDAVRFPTDHSVSMATGIFQ